MSDLNVPVPAPEQVLITREEQKQKMDVLEGIAETDPQEYKESIDNVMDRLLSTTEPELYNQGKRNERQA